MIHLDAVSFIEMAAVGLIGAAINTLAGGGTLLTFPVLLAIGYPALVANVSNTLGLLPGYAGGSLSYRRELAGQGRRVIILGVAGAVGALVGAYLLTRTSSSAFRAVVPWLILFACVLLAVQPLVSRRLAAARQGPATIGPLLIAGDAAGGVYGAFFGAGLGVMLLAVLGLFLTDSLQRLNALKGVISMVVNGVAAICFAIAAPVAWPAVAAMAPAAFLGGFAGAALARRVPPTPLRIIVVVLGIVVAVRLLV
ncbi:MAG TPA: sulfite exporter TauE/SafE family protein [Candidatus Dormibacteraeota bacterium]